MTVQEFTSRYCYGLIQRELPDQFMKSTLAEVLTEVTRRGAAARKCSKLLGSKSVSKVKGRRSMTGLSRLLQFLDYLRSRGIQFSLSQQQVDGIMVSFRWLARESKSNFSRITWIFRNFLARRMLTLTKTNCERLLMNDGTNRAALEHSISPSLFRRNWSVAQKLRN